MTPLTIPLPLLALSIAVTTVYLIGLWSFLRQETSATVMALVAMAAMSMVLRVVFAGHYPEGFNGDELSKFYGGVLALRNPGINLWAEDPSGWPVLLNALFLAPMQFVFGPTAAALRFYSTVTSVLSTPMTFAAGRALGLSRVSSLTAAALVTVLPWSIFFGRVSNGGELLFHGLFVLTGLAGLVRGRGGWVEMLLAGFGLCLLFYDYGCGRPWLVLPIAAALLAQGWARVFCLLVPVLALAGFAPQLLARYDISVTTFGAHIDPQLWTDPFGLLLRGSMALLAALTGPWAADYWLTVSHAAMHPYWLLALVVVGLIGEWRTTLFLCAAFGLAVLTVVATDGDRPSVHRMLLAFPIMALLAARPLNLVRPPFLQWLMAVLICSVAGVQSVSAYFSSDFWPEPSRNVFDASSAQLNEGLPRPVPGRLVATMDLGAVFYMRSGMPEDLHPFHMEEWIPRDGVPTTYAFSFHWLPLRPVYDAVFGPARVKPFGHAFTVELESGDWSMLRRYGWSLVVSCPYGARRLHVPFLFHHYQGSGRPCGHGIEHHWLGEWRGAPAKLQFAFVGSGRVLVNGTLRGQSESDGLIAFDVNRGDRLDLALVGARDVATVHTYLMEETPVGLRVPAWEMIGPLDSADAAAAGNVGAADG